MAGGARRVTHLTRSTHVRRFLVGARRRASCYGCSRIGVPGQVLSTIRAVAIPALASVGSIRSMPEWALKNPIWGQSFTKYMLSATVASDTALSFSPVGELTRCG